MKDRLNEIANILRRMAQEENFNSEELKAIAQALLALAYGVL